MADTLDVSEIDEALGSDGQAAKLMRRQAFTHYCFGYAISNCMYRAKLLSEPNVNHIVVGNQDASGNFVPVATVLADEYYSE